MSSGEQVSQTRFDLFHDYGEFGPPNEPSLENILPGQKAVDVFCEIVRLNPAIEAFSVKFYDPYNDSSDSETIDTTQNPIYLPRDLAKPNILRDISRVNEEINTLRAYFIPAVCSTVKLIGGEEYHIPMMDFVVPKFDVEEIDRRNISLLTAAMFPHKGALLFTGYSYHFWGTGLISKKEWSDRIANYKNAEINRKEKDLEALFDLGYLKKAIECEHTALRLFGYEDTVKDFEPTVVSVLK